ncbi:hypothetical protein A7Q01_00150 [Eikenella sp. NML96-A-049]|uniref:hypothetical protein n=1 Tax=unclassified Eikenella TaxID=2639367 RepID=UPI0007E24724|nr:MULTISPECIES: hypothetical protein [unclassified Eikenella]OAM35511.1 hypothetical protein A7P97_00030 [Eikenella sp. NML070372]OAM43286.1 hypothetical protein A7Q01_00150 [Eikenella sp. NML96-A-049]
MKKFLTVQNGIIVALCIMVGLLWYVSLRLHNRVSRLELELRNKGSVVEIQQEIQELKTSQLLLNGNGYRECENLKGRLNSLGSEVFSLDTRVRNIEAKVGY